MDADVTETTGRYLSAVLLVSEREGRPAKTGEVAERLDVTPASVTERLETLDERGLVDREKYVGATLTDDGEAVTRELMWKHCLAENFLAADLDVEGADAFGVGNALSDEAALALRSLIDHPCSSTCRAPNAEYDACRGNVRDPSV
ncbi:metal-dependent transcriptional regulator [Halarchaeum sp. P4]|uniref:metal-dependent transcriptional regulator n=1 Tax=Halarchaeum sp. P4 TaxID=3421639 RepID=UPI003EBAAE5B